MEEDERRDLSGWTMAEVSFTEKLFTVITFLFDEDVSF